MDDKTSKADCISDVDCPAGEFCYVSISGQCNSDKSCSITCTGASKRDVLGLMGTLSGRGAILEKKYMRRVMFNSGTVVEAI